MISPVKTLVTATAVSQGGRNGHSETTDKSVAVDLSVPKEMGGPGRAGTTTPEHLFATGYAACFGGALDFVASSKKKNAKNAIVTCAVGVGPREAGGFGIVVKMSVAEPSIPQAELEQMVHETHENICPYSHATRGNIAIEFEVKGG